MQCPQCGYMNPDGAKACSCCGYMFGNGWQQGGSIAQLQKKKRNKVLLIVLLACLLAAAAITVLVILLSSGGPSDDTPMNGQSALFKFAERSDLQGRLPSGDLHYNSKLDRDGNNILDCVENDDRETDTDEDGLTDYQELVLTGTDPLTADTDGNGVNDYDDDCDGDGLSNGYEISIGTSAVSRDSDGDGLTDAEELNETQTDCLKADTDGDGASDGWEIQHGYNPRRPNQQFDTEASAQSQLVSASLSISAPGEVAESISVRVASNDPMVNETIPGYIDSAFEFHTLSDDVGIATVSFDFDKALQERPDLSPSIYGLNEETNTWYELETSVSGHVAQAVAGHAGKYILLDKTAYGRYVETAQSIDPNQVNGPDSNGDGISDYVTLLMCQGIIRTSTGALVFGDSSYEEVQANADLDGDGLKNGEEVQIKSLAATIPEDAQLWNGHYYKAYELGDTWDAAQAYCLGLGGHLVTITSAEEQELVKSLVFAGEKNSYWLGARGGNCVFSWVTGEEWTCDYGQYNNTQKSGYEDSLMMYRLDNPMAKSERAGMWNDLHHDGVCGDEPFFGIDDFGFVCEWEDQEYDGVLAYLQSSPILADTDFDGFEDRLDPTPLDADVFKTMEDYVHYWYGDSPTVTLCVRQPVWDSRLCYSFDERSMDPYYVSGGNGHAFLFVTESDGASTYLGYYPSWGGKLLLLGIRVEGLCATEQPVFSVAKTFPATDEQISNLAEYVIEHTHATYQLSTYNCTTFAVQAMQYCGISIKVYPHHWFHTLETALLLANLTGWTDDRDNILEKISDYYYGYSPADAAQDIKENYGEYVATRQYQLKDGSVVDAYEVLQRGR